MIIDIFKAYFDGPAQTPGRRKGRSRIPWQRVAVVAFLVYPLMAKTVQAGDDRGRQLYKLCASCHGVEGHGNQNVNAPAIAGLQPWYVKAQLEKFKKGIRGYHPDDYAGLQMRPMARSLMDNTDVEAVTAYIATLKPTKPVATFQGNSDKGKIAYAVCSACHGQKGEGVQAMNAPSLQHLPDWYMFAQVQKFKAGQRGTHKQDATGASMRPMSFTLVDDQAVMDVLAYIGTLSSR